MARVEGVLEQASEGGGTPLATALGWEVVGLEAACDPWVGLALGGPGEDAIYDLGLIGHCLDSPDFGATAAVMQLTSGLVHDGHTCRES